MALDSETVARIARLARIRMTSNELAPMATELDNILGWIEQLSEVDTDGVEPMTSVSGMKGRQRPDMINDGGIQEKVLANAPEQAEGFYVVPKVVE